MGMHHMMPRCAAALRRHMQMQPVWLPSGALLRPLSSCAAHVLALGTQSLRYVKERSLQTVFLGEPFGNVMILSRSACLLMACLMSGATHFCAAGGCLASSLNLILRRLEPAMGSAAGKAKGQLVVRRQAGRRRGQHLGQLRWDCPPQLSKAALPPSKLPASLTCTLTIICEVHCIVARIFLRAADASGRWAASPSSSTRTAKPGMIDVSNEDLKCRLP